MTSVNSSKRNKCFNEEQLQIIQRTLDASIVKDNCIPKKILFEEISAKFSLDMEQYQFENLLTKAIRSGTIHGYDIRQGRNGGVCLAGAFEEKDSEKSVSVTLNGRTIKVSKSKRKVLSIFLSDALESKDGSGNLFVNNRLYSIPEKIDTIAFLERCLTGE